MTEIKTLSAKQVRAIEALLVEPTTRAAAAAAGVSEATIWRWMADPDFATAYRGARERLLENALTSLQATATEAVGVLRTTMNSEAAPPAVRVSAARAVLEFALRAQGELETQQRLAELERLLALRRATI